MNRPESAELAARVCAGDPAAASKALSWVVNESEGFEELARAFFAHAGRSHKIGISGPPGSGKSSLLGRLVAWFRGRREKVGILAVDPTSPFTGGAFLGDRLRVQEHLLDPGVFFRSLGSRGMIGGVSATIFGAIHVLEAFGCDRILVETVGTGQDEVEIFRVADSVLYVTTPSLGDDIQAMKAGAMETADIFVVNKADLDGAEKALYSLRAALSLGGPSRPWPSHVLAASSLTGQGIPELTALIEDHKSYLASSGEAQARAMVQLKEEVSLFVSRRLSRDILSRISGEDLRELRAKRTDPVTLGERLIRGVVHANTRRASRGKGTRNRVRGGRVQGEGRLR